MHPLYVPSRKPSGSMGAMNEPHRMRDFLDTVPLIDGHNDLAWEARVRAGYDWGVLDISHPQPQVHTDLPRLRAGGVAAQFWSVFVPGTLPEQDALIATLEQIDGVRRMVARYPEHLALATTADDIDRVHGTGRIASLMGAEGGHSIAGSLAMLRTLHWLGVRYLTLTHNQNVGWADSATDVADCGGLSAFGLSVVAEMNTLGMMVDLSHVADSTMWAALNASRAPVIFSHSSARTICDTPRNVPDDVLATMARHAGVCMVTFVPQFVSQACADWVTGQQDAAHTDGVDRRDHVAWEQWLAPRRDGRPTATLQDVVRHLDHVRDVAGIDHVGIGGDFDGTGELPEGLEDVSCYPRLFAALADRGWSDDDLAKVAGGNVQRVMRDVEAMARASVSDRQQRSRSRPVCSHASGPPSSTSS